MHTLALPALHRFAAATPVVVRVLIGVIMTAHGWQKLTEMGPANFGNQMLGGLGLPAPVLLGWVVTLLELVGGIALIVGVFTRVSALLLAAVLVGATVLVKVDIGLLAGPDAPLPGAELDLALLAGLITVTLLGPGPLSIDRMLGIERSVPTLRPDGEHATA